MKYLFLAMIFSLVFAGCQQMANPSSETLVTYKDDKGREISYKSNKQQQGFDARFSLDKDGNPSASVKVDNSGTQESVVAAMAETQKAIASMLDRLISSGAMAGT